MLRCVYIVAEAQLGHTLRRAAALLAAATPALHVSLQGYTIDELDDVPVEQLRADIAAADVFIGSMLNSDAESTLLEQMLKQHRPPVTLFFTSQPELTMLTRIGSFDATSAMHDRAGLMQLVGRLQAAGVSMPPIPHALLPAMPRLSQRLGPDVLGDLWPYGRAGSYWLNASPDNLANMLLYVATMAPGHDHIQWQPEPPEIYPAVALWHPAAETYFHSYEEYSAWYRGYRSELHARANGGRDQNDVEQLETTRPTVGVVVFRQYVTGGTFAHYAAAIAALEAQGLDVVCGFGGMDNSALVRDYFLPADIQLLLNLTGFNLVGSMGRPQPDRAVALLKELNIPYLAPFPLLFQTAAQWHADPIGLAPMQTALQVVLPELEGATEPRVFATKGDDDNFAPDDEQLTALARRVRRHVDLRTKSAKDKRIALTIFSFPPDKGSVGSAAYLDVFQSVYNLLIKLRAQGYTVDVPADVGSLQQLVLGGDQALPGSPSVAVADTLPTERYRELTPSMQRIEANFGPAPGLIDSDATGLQIKGRAFGNVFVGVQPGFGYEGDPMRLLFAKDASPSHSFAAYYAWLRHEWQADAVVHFGTHGALEFMPGKQVGMTPDCWPDGLTGDLPHLYFYSMNNPSEATIAKRRSYATMVTYLSPPLREAGLYRTLLSLNEALEAYREAVAARASVAAANTDGAATIDAAMSSSPRFDDAFETVRSLAQQANLDADVPPPADGEPREAYIARLSAYVQTLAERLIPVGLHVAGQHVSDAEAAEFLWATLQHPRPDENMPALPQWIAAERGLKWDELDAGDSQRDEVVAAARRKVDEYVRSNAAEDVAADVSTGAATDIASDADSQQPAQRIAAFATDFLARLRHDGELDALIAGLGGGYIEPAPGGDPARVPAALPTGRNLHALDPQRIPSPVARQRAHPVVQQLLDRIVEQDGAYPETIACVLWGTDNIKTQGEGVAQVLELIGVEPVADSLGRMTRLRLIPLDELGRPRIDVVLSVSGIFRDIFPNVMELLDRAVQLAAAAPEDVEHNYIRKHALAIAGQLDVPFEDATRRVFSNAPGAYGTGVNNVVEASTWETDDDLADVFIERKAYAFGASGAVHSPELLEACLQTCTATFQNLDSTEIGLSDVDHYFEYLGGLAVATKSVRGSAPAAFVADTLSPDMAVRGLDETLRLETRTRLLNPRWYEGMLEHGYQGVHEIATRLDNTFGWSATADAVDEWIYTAAADTFILDDAMRERMTGHNPRAVQRMAGRLAEAHERGFWQGDDERLTKLRHIVMQTEDLLEGIV